MPPLYGCDLRPFPSIDYINVPVPPLSSHFLSPWRLAPPSGALLRLPGDPPFSPFSPASSTPPFITVRTYWSSEPKLFYLPRSLAAGTGTRTSLSVLLFSGLFFRRGEIPLDLHPLCRLSPAAHCLDDYSHF